MSEKRSVLFICLGNICRSPIAEAVFKKLIRTREIEDQWTVDSAALGDWHVGENIEERTARVLEQHANYGYTHTVRQITCKDFFNFEFIIGMDKENMNELANIAPKGSTAKMFMLGKYDFEGEKIIRDPYYHRGLELFHVAYKQCVKYLNAFLDEHQGPVADGDQDAGGCNQVVGAERQDPVGDGHGIGLTCEKAVSVTSTDDAGPAGNAPM